MPVPQGQETNQFRCEFCGRFFNDEEEFAEHRRECGAAHQSGAEKPVADDPRKEGGDREWTSKP